MIIRFALLSLSILSIALGTPQRDRSSIPVQRPRLVELGADKCIPCKMMAPILAELKREYTDSLQVDFIDVWKKQDEAERYSISVIPTQIFYAADGKELYRHQGFFAKKDILAKWTELGIKLVPSNGKTSDKKS